MTRAGAAGDLVPRTDFSARTQAWVPRARARSAARRTTTVLAATGAVVALVDVALVELTKRVRKPTPGGEPVPTVAEAEGGALHP
jgi:hypothetical protein